MSKNVCVVTGSRAEYGLLRWVMEEIVKHHDLSLQLIVTGSHLSPMHGLTYEAIVEDGFQIDRRVEMLLNSDTGVGIGKSIGLGVIGFADALAELTPDLVLVLGDRFEILAAVSAALAARIPVAHIHGGEVTEGAIDDAIRHAITKMSHLHFVAADDYRDRVVQMGEPPERVHNVGALGIDGMQRLELLAKPELEAELDFRFGGRTLLVTYHPVTLRPGTGAADMKELLAALDEAKNTSVIFTLPNADMERHEISEMIDDFVRARPHTRAYKSLGQLKYLSCMKYADAVVGNSSSGIIEAPAFGKPTIDIGERQRGRARASSVIECPAERGAITAALARAYSDSFQRSLRAVDNPYGAGGASEKIVAAIAATQLDELLIKRFQDLEFRQQ